VANELVEFARACCHAAEMHERLRFAEEIVVRVGPMLGAFVAAHCPEAAVEDVLQEALIGIANGAPNFRGNTDLQFWKWCYRIASNKLADYLRRKSNQPMLSLDVEEIRRAVEATAADPPISEDDREKLEMALGLLARSKPPCVVYLTLYFIQGLDYRELAAVFRSTANAIRMQIHRCLTLARQLAANEG
jgi:RNA polymerase sigma factor (sigma-70 family)